MNNESGVFQAFRFASWSLLCLVMLGASGCGGGQVLSNCGQDGAAASDGVRTYCAYGVVVGGIRPCPDGMQSIGEFVSTDGRRKLICSSAAGQPGTGACLAYNLVCDVGDTGVLADMGILADTGIPDAARNDTAVPDGGVFRMCPTTWPTSGDTCTDEVQINTYCRYQCSGGDRIATCAGSGASWSGAAPGGENNCVLQYQGLYADCPSTAPSDTDPQACQAEGAICQYECASPDSRARSQCSNGFWQTSGVGDWRQCLRAGVVMGCPLAPPPEGASCGGHPIGLTCVWGAVTASCSAGRWTIR